MSILVKLFKQIFRKKLIIGISLILIIVGGYFGYQGLTKDDGATRYVTAAVERGTIITSISGGGTISLAEEVGLDFDSNGRITNIYVEEGEEVEKGDWLSRVDSTELQLQVALAKVNLADKDEQLAELLSEATAAELRSLGTAVEIARLNLEEAKQDYEEFIANDPPEQRELDDAKNKMDELELRYLDLKEEYEDMQNGYGELEIKKAQIAYDKALATYNRANQEYIDLINDPTPTQAEIQAAQNKMDEKYAAYQEALAYEALKLAELNEDPDNSVKQAEYQLAQAQRESAYTAWQNAVDEYNNIRSNPPSDQQDIEDARIKRNELEIKYLEAQDELDKKQKGYTQAELKSIEIGVSEALADWEEAEELYDDLVNNESPNELEIAKAQNEVSKAEVAYLEAQEKLEDVKRGADENSVTSLEAQVAKARLDLSEAEDKLASALLVSPINGVVVEINQKVGEKAGEQTLSNGGAGGSSFITIVSKDYLANITLNEVDIARVELGQLATFTFDAIDELTLTGKVIEIDSLGSITQGVVTYDVKIALDTQDERLKSGMSLSVAIITDTKQDVLMVSNSAIKQQGDTAYVQVADTTTIESNLAAANISGVIIPTSNLRTQQVQVGLSNDTMTEIIDGLKEGDIVITQMVSSSNQSQTQQNSGFGGSSQMQGQMFRMMR